MGKTYERLTEETVNQDAYTVPVGKRQAKKAAAKKKRAQIFWRIVRRTLLVFFTLIIIAATALVLLVLGKPMLNKLDRIKVKYGILE